MAGKSKIGQALGDEIDHMEFYVNKKAMVSTMSELFGIVETEEQRVKELKDETTGRKR